VRHHLTADRGILMMASSSGNWGAPKFTWLCLDSMAGDCKQAWLPLTVNCTVWCCHCISWAFKSLSLRTSLLMEISSHNLFSDTRFGGPNIQLVRIKLNLHWMHWELTPHWLIAVRGWAGVSSYPAQSLNRLCLLRFSLWRSSSFNREWTGRIYFRISRHRSKHTT